MIDYFALSGKMVVRAVGFVLELIKIVKYKLKHAEIVEYISSRVRQHQICYKMLPNRWKCFNISRSKKCWPSNSSHPNEGLTVSINIFVKWKKNNVNRFYLGIASKLCVRDIITWQERRHVHARMQCSTNKWRNVWKRFSPSCSQAY